MINSTLDTPAPRARWLRQALTIAPAALVMIVYVTTRTAYAAGNSISPAAQSTPEQSAPHMTPAEKDHALTEFMRRDAAGEKIDPALLKAFIEAQNEGATTGSRSARPLLALN
jgi:hypothetical protein